MNRTTIPADLIVYVNEEILPQYTNFDKAHRMDHAVRVIEESLQLARFYDVDLPMVYGIAAYHDLGLSEGREFHHIASGKILLGDEQLHQWFSDDQLHVMQEAIEDHRASNAHEPRSIYGKIVAEADRIIDPELTLRRTVQYGLSKYPEMDKEEQFKRFKKHVEEKYGVGGYIKLWIPQSENAKQLSGLRRIIADDDQLLAIFNTLYAEETE